MNSSSHFAVIAPWVIPVEPAGTVLRDHAVVVEGTQITALLPAAQARAKYASATTIELPNHAILPGFVNAHTHAAMTLFRGLADDLPLMQWLTQHIWPAEQKWVGTEFVRDGTELAIAEMIRSGTTCFSDMYFFPEETARACVDAHMRAVVGMILVDFPTPYAQTIDEYLHKGLKLHDDLRTNTLVTTAFAPHAPYSVSDDPFNRLRTFNAEINRPVHIHVHETAHEVDDAVTKSGVRPLARLAQLDLVDPNLVAVHMTQLSDEEIAQLAAVKANVVHCPQSNLKLASGFCHVSKLLAAGVNVALGTDGAASNNDLDMIEEMRTAALLGKAVSGNAAAVAAPVALQMATLNGARAFGLDDQIGSLTAGKQADFIAIDLSATSTTPVYDPISQIVYSAVRDQVTDSWISGKRVMQNRQLTSLDEQRIRQRAEHWRIRIAEHDTQAEATN